MEELLIIEHFIKNDIDLELRPGSVNVLNIPTGSIKKTKELSERVGTFWDAYNLNFIHTIIDNKSQVNVLLVADPRKKEVLKRKVISDGVTFFKPTIYSQELQYLLTNGIDNGLLLGFNRVNFKDISFEL